MSDPTPPKETSAQPNPPAEAGGPGAERPVDAGASGKTVPKALTPEEQMELYEKDLKENDWGHQPC